MIVIRVELHSAVTGEVTEIARADIWNVGGSATRGNYETAAFRGRDKETLAQRRPQRSGSVADYPRLSLHVFNLVARALASLGYK